jgi:hypothetical protein
MSDIAICLLILFLIFAAVIVVSALILGIVRMARRIRNLNRKGEAEDQAVRANRQYIRRCLENGSVL